MDKVEASWVVKPTVWEERDVKEQNVFRLQGFLENQVPLYQMGQVRDLGSKRANTQPQVTQQNSQAPHLPA